MRSSVLRLHQALILSEQVTYERINGRVASPSDLMQLAVNDAWFTWLHPFAVLVERIDELLENDSALSRVGVTHWLSHIRSAIQLSKAGDGFARSYYEALMRREPNVVRAHMEVSHLLTSDADE